MERFDILGHGVRRDAGLVKELNHVIDGYTHNISNDVLA